MPDGALSHQAHHCDDQLGRLHGTPGLRDLLDAVPDVVERFEGRDTGTVL